MLSSMETLLMTTDDDLPSRLRRVLDQTPATQEEIARRASVSLKWVNNVKNAEPGRTFDAAMSDRLRHVLDAYLAEHIEDIAGLIEEWYEPGSAVDEQLQQLLERHRKRRR